MYLQRLQCRRSISKSQAILENVARSRLRRLSHISQKWRKDATRQGPRLSESQLKDKESRQQQEPTCSSIRPIWLFALGIPVGYGLNWALKKNDEVAADTTADGFVKHTLANKEDISSTCSIFTLKPTASANISTNDAPSKRTITSVQFKQPQLQIARHYTLLPPKEDEDPQQLRFLIRKERNGEVSGYLHRLPTGSQVELRGLNAEYVLPEKVDTVLFLAGGTGIAPAMQVADALAGQANVHILWANRKREDCVGGISDSIREIERSWSLSGWWTPYELSSFSGKGHVPKKSSEEESAIVSQLNHLKHRFEMREEADSVRNVQSSLLIDYYVDEENNLIQPKDVQRLLQLTSRDSSRKDSSDAKKILFVSGPEGFVNHWAAPKQWLNGREVQGQLGGVLSTLNLRGWEVVKL